MDLDALRAFIAVVDTGSFSQAARSVDSALSTLRRRVDELEAGSGVELLKRAADTVRTTRAGETLAERGRAVLRETKQVIEAVRALELHNRLLTIEIPLGLPPTVEQVAHRTFRKAIPALRYRVRYNTGVFDPNSDASFVLHLGRRPAASNEGARDESTSNAESQPPPSTEGWLHSKVAKMSVGLAASRSYLESKGTPTTLEDLASHDLLIWERAGVDPTRLPCASYPSGFEVSPILVSPSANLIRRFAQSDEGIAYVPSSRVLRFIDEKDPLVPVLENEVFDQFWLWMAVRGGEKAGPIGVLGQSIGRLIKTMYTG